MFERIIKQLWKERCNLVNWKAPTEEDKEDKRERLKIVTDDLHKFLELLAQSKIKVNQQKIDLDLVKKKVAKEIRLQHESEVGFVDTDQAEY